MTPELFNDGEMLSRSNQPSIAELMRLLADPTEQITFVVGAGLSIDAGLPSWRALLERMADEIGDFEGVRFGELSKKDPDDLVRRAEYLLEALIAKRGHGTRKEAIRSALYDGYKNTQPGPISYALARLVAALSGRTSILTTNFDNVLDRAFMEMDPEFSVALHPLCVDEVIDDAISNGSLPIVHLHGRLSRMNTEGDLDLGNVVLTESDFLLHGREVRQAIASRLASSVTIFLGLSLTDPNLIGPLWDTKNGRKPAFVLTVPGEVPGASSIEEARAYGIVKHNYLSTTLGLKPIFLKSYTQLGQLLQEFRIAHQDLAAYLEDSGPDSLAYGPRFERLLSRCYEALGYAISDGKVEGQSSPGATSSLGELATASRAPRNHPGGSTVEGLLAQFRSDSKIRRRLELLRHQVGDIHPVDEVFSTFLWLRNLTTDGSSRYSLRLVANSEFTISAEQASAFRDVPILRESPYTPARVLATGRGSFWNLPLEATLGSWNGVLSVPIRLWESFANQTHIPTTVGALSLQSSHHYLAPRETFPTGANLSIFSALDPSQKVDLMTALEKQGRLILADATAVASQDLVS